MTQLDGAPGCDKANSKSSMAPLLFLSRFTRDSIAFSAHFSSSSPCFQPKTKYKKRNPNEPSRDQICKISLTEKTFDIWRRKVEKSVKGHDENERTVCLMNFQVKVGFLIDFYLW